MISAPPNKQKETTDFRSEEPKGDRGLTMAQLGNQPLESRARLLAPLTRCRPLRRSYRPQSSRRAHSRYETALGGVDR